MIKNLFIVIFISTVNLTFGQVKCVVSDSTKRQMFIKALENYSTSPNFIVFKAVTINSNEPREICQLGGYFINKTLENNSAKIFDWDKQIIQFTSFIIADTTFYEKYDSTLNAVTEKRYIKKIELLPFDSIKYNYLESKFGNILIENAKQVIDINKKLMLIGWNKNSLDLRYSLERVKSEQYKIIRELYCEYKNLVPHFYFNHGILTSTGCYAGEFQINRNFNE